MLISAIKLAPERQIPRIALVIGLGMLVLVIASVARDYIDLLDRAQDRTVEFSASYRGIPDFASLTREADLVIVGQVITGGTTHLVAQPAGTPRAGQQAPQVSLPDEKVQAVKQHPPAPKPAADPGHVANIPQGTPVTTFTVQVERVLRGTAPANGQITVTQPGGKLELPTFPGGPTLKRTVQFEHDTLMSAGERHVMFLKHADDGTVFVVGGPQGRLSVDRGGKVHAIDAGTPATHGHDGQLLESFAAEVEAVK